MNIRDISGIFITLAVLSFCNGCAVDDFKTATGSPLSFSVGVKNLLETKADGRKTSTSELNKFFVAGFNNRGLVWFPGQDVNTNSMKFPEYIWKDGAAMTFFAYANIEPSSGATATISNSGIFLDYLSLPEYQSDQPDILFGYYSGLGNNGKADLTFNHPLASVAFKFGTFITDGATVIKEVRLNGVYTSGQATASLVSGVPQCSWTASGTGTVKSSNLSITPSAGVSLGDPFIVIPQNLGTDPVSVEIVAEVAGSPVTYSVWLPAESDFEAGKTTTFTVIKDGTTTAGLRFEVSVADWGDGGKIAQADPIIKDQPEWIRFSAPTEHTITFEGYSGYVAMTFDYSLLIGWSYDTVTWHQFTFTKTSDKQGSTVNFGGQYGDVYYRGWNEAFFAVAGIPAGLRFVIDSQKEIASIVPDVSVDGNVMCIIDSKYGDEDNESQYPVGGLFLDCTALKDASGLKIPKARDTLAGSGCYGKLFSGCTNLVFPPRLDAEILDGSCYFHMFEGCTSLTQAPALPATTLANNCYSNMFEGCTSLTQAPDLPATTLANNCYNYMFYGCTSLTQAPALPATTLADNCYSYMFRECTSLTQAPDLPATTLASSCYYNMFYGCSSLNYIKMLAPVEDSSNSFTNWVKGVSATGTMVMSNGSSLPRGDSGIPNDWNVIYE